METEPFGWDILGLLFGQLGVRFVFGLQSLRFSLSLLGLSIGCQLLNFLVYQFNFVSMHLPHHIWPTSCVSNIGYDHNSFDAFSFDNL